MDLLGGLTSILGGGITGVIGTVAQSVYAYKSKQLDVDLQKDKNASDILMKKADAEIMAQEWAARTKIVDTEAAAQVETEDAKAFNTSLTSEPQKYSEGPLSNKQNWLMVTLDFFRGLIRPGLTVYLCAITTAVYLQAKTLMGAGLPVAQAYELTSQVVNTVLYLTTTCVLWYFGSRNKVK